MRKFNATCRTVESNPNRTIKTETIQIFTWYTIMVQMEILQKSIQHDELINIC